MNLVEALNIIVQHGAGVRPISTEQEAPPGAATELDRVRKRVLKGGWPFCTDTVDLTRDVTGIITLQPNVIGVYLPKPFVTRSRKIYDPTKQTFTLERDFPKSQVIIEIAFEDLPNAVADLIAWEAARDYAAIKRGPDSPRYAHCEDKRQIAEVELSTDYPALSGQDNPDRRYCDPFTVGGGGDCRWVYTGI